MIRDGVPGRKIVAAFDSHAADEAIGAALPLETQGLDGLSQSASVQQITALRLLRRRLSWPRPRTETIVPSARFSTSHVEIFDPIADLTVDQETRQAHRRSAFTDRRRPGSQSMRHHFSMSVEHRTSPRSVRVTPRYTAAGISSS